MRNATDFLNSIVDAWEALPGGRQVRNRDVEQWLADDMSPAINAIRGFLHRPKPDGTMVPAPEGIPPSEDVEPSISAIMEQAQVFASTYSLVGGRFDDGSKMTQSNEEKADLERMIRAAFIAREVSK